MANVDATNVNANDFQELNAVASKALDVSSKGRLKLNLGEESSNIKDVCKSNAGFPTPAGANVEELPFDEADFIGKCQSIGINAQGVEIDKLAKEVLEYEPVCLVE